MDNNNQNKIPITQEGLVEIKKDYDELVNL